jgi:5-methylcytosine-specific restriction endonuclease McrA
MQSCLALNASFEPLKLIPMKRAVRLVLLGKAELVEGDPTEVIRSENRTLARPVVIRLVKFIRVPARFRRKVTNTFMFARDQYTCQYCGRHERELNRREGLNRDHVVPKSKGGENTWTNCVTACSSCNSKKDNKTPAEAHMKLLRVPTEPHLVALMWAVRRLTPLQAKYIELFYGAETVKALR